jgi:hypothetical protein
VNIILPQVQGRFEGKYRLHKQRGSLVNCYRTTRRHTPEVSHLCENLTSLHPILTNMRTIISVIYYNLLAIFTWFCKKKNFKKHLLTSPCLSVCLHSDQYTGVCLDGLRKTVKNVRITSVLAENRTDMNLGRYHCSNLLGAHNSFHHESCSNIKFWWAFDLMFSEVLTTRGTRYCAAGCVCTG